MSELLQSRCRQKLRAAGQPYPKSNCEKCGSLIRPGWKCAEEAAASVAEPITPHQCLACPIEVRDLYACAANLVIVVEAVLNGSSSPERARKKLDELAVSVGRMRPIVEAHFRDMERHPNA